MRPIVQCLKTISSYFVQFCNYLKREVSVISFWLELVVTSIIWGGSLLLPSFPACVQHTYSLLYLWLRCFKSYLLTYSMYTLILQNRIIFKTFPYYTSTSTCFCWKKVETEISKKKKEKKLPLGLLHWGYYFDTDISWYTDLRSRRTFSLE